MRADAGQSLGDILSAALAKRSAMDMTGKADVSKYLLEEAAKFAAANSNKILAIKLVREYSGMGLKEAKDFVDNGFKFILSNGQRVHCHADDEYYYITNSMEVGGARCSVCVPENDTLARGHDWTPVDILKRATAKPQIFSGDEIRACHVSD